MSKSDPFRRFLGVDATAGPHELLGLPTMPLSKQVIDEALHRQLERVNRHPASHTIHAEAVRRALRETAASLPADGTAAQPRYGQGIIAASPSRKRQRQIELTAFDQLVLGVLVAFGGWNRASRAKLAAIAAAHGVTVDGLIRVVAGLSEYAGSGGGRVDVSEMAQGASRFGVTPAMPQSRHTSLEQWRDKFAPELASGTTWALAKLAALFSLIMLIGGVLFYRALVDSPKQPTQTPVVERAPATGGEQPTSPRPSDDSTQPPVDSPQLATFPNPPTFQGDRLPDSAEAAADLAPGLAESVEALGRKLALAGDDPSDAVYRQWADAMETLGRSWPIVSPRTNRSMIEAGTNALVYAEHPAVAEELIATLAQPERIDQPLDIWRSAWVAGITGEIVSHPNLPPTVTAPAQQLLDVALGGPTTTREMNFDLAAGRRLDALASTLTEQLGVNPDALDNWELWLIAQEKLRDKPQRMHAYLAAVEAILKTEVDLSRPGQHSAVLGRLLSLIDFRTDPLVRDTVVQWVSDDPAIAANDVWVLTSMLAQYDFAPWFERELVVSFDAGREQRNVAGNKLALAWPVAADLSSPAPEGTPLVIPMDTAGRWQSLLSRFVSLPRSNPDDITQMRRLYTAGLFNEAALFIAERDRSSAENLLDEIAAELDRRQADSTALWADATPRQRIGRPAGPDGQWANTYSELRATEKRLQQLRSLRVRNADDLGPVDAARFVREVYRGSPREVRNVAQALVVELFRYGPNVAREMLDQFPDAPDTDGTSIVISRLTERALPSGRDEQWRRAARLALVEHLLSLSEGQHEKIDHLASLLAKSRREQLGVLIAGAITLSAESSAVTALRELVRTWRTRATQLMVTDPAPATLGALDRRRATRLRLARGQIQRHVAEQISLLELLAYHAVAMQPAVREQILTALETNAANRRRAITVLEQAVRAELGIAKLWQIRFDLATPSEKLPQGGSE